MLCRCSSFKGIHFGWQRSAKHHRSLQFSIRLTDQSCREGFSLPMNITLFLLSWLGGLEQSAQCDSPFEPDIESGAKGCGTGVWLFFSGAKRKVRRFTSRFPLQRRGDRPGRGGSCQCQCNRILLERCQPFGNFWIRHHLYWRPSRRRCQRAGVDSSWAFEIRK